MIMKYLTLSILFFLFNAGELFSQYTLDWMIPSGHYNKTAVISARDSYENLIVTGYLPNENIYTRKYDIEGTFLWEATDSSGIQSRYQKPIWINCDTDDNVLVVGKRYSISGQWEYPDAVVAMKYDPSGVLLWKQVIPVSVLVGFPHPAFNLRSETDHDGNLYIGTAAASPSGFVLIKIDPEGTILFTHNNTTNAPTGFWSMRLKGNIIVLTGSAGNINDAPVVAYDTSGSLLWTALGIGQAGKDVEIDDEGNVYLLTSYPDLISPDSDQDIVLYKFDPAGTQLWKKEYDLGGSDFPTRFTLVANKLSATGWGTDNKTGSPYFDLKTFQLDITGELEWYATYDGTAFNDEYPTSVVSKPDGRVIVTGIGGPSPDPFNLSLRQMIILEYSPSGDQIWIDTPNIYGGEGLSCLLASDHSLYVISSHDMTVYHYLPNWVALPEAKITREDVLKIFPNPVSTTGILEFEATGDKMYTFVLYDQMGKFIKTLSAGKLRSGRNQIPVNLTGLNDGIYFCRVVSDNTLHTVKVVKSRPWIIQ